MTIALGIHKLWLRLCIGLCLVAGHELGMGQDKKVDVAVHTNKNGSWYASPWVWMVGAAAFVVLLVAILKSGSRRTDAV